MDDSLPYSRAFGSRNDEHVYGYVEGGLKMKTINLIVGFLVLMVLVVAGQNKAVGFDPEFEKLCKDRTPDNWMSMMPMKDGKFTSDKSCWGCMSDDGMSHFCNMEEYRAYVSSQN